MVNLARIAAEYIEGYPVEHIGRHRLEVWKRSLERGLSGQENIPLILNHIIRCEEYRSEKHKDECFKIKRKLEETLSNFLKLSRIVEKIMYEDEVTLDKLLIRVGKDYYLNLAIGSDTVSLLVPLGLSSYAQELLARVLQGEKLHIKELNVEGCNLKFSGRTISVDFMRGYKQKLIFPGGVSLGYTGPNQAVGIEWNGSELKVDFWMIPHNRFYFVRISRNAIEPALFSPFNNFYIGSGEKYNLKFNTIIEEFSKFLKVIGVNVEYDKKISVKRVIEKYSDVIHKLNRILDEMITTMFFRNPSAPYFFEIFLKDIVKRENLEDSVPTVPFKFYNSIKKFSKEELKKMRLLLAPLLAGLLPCDYSSELVRYYPRFDENEMMELNVISQLWTLVYNVASIVREYSRKAIREMQEKMDNILISGKGTDIILKKYREKMTKELGFEINESFRPYIDFLEKVALDDVAYILYGIEIVLGEKS